MQRFRPASAELKQLCVYLFPVDVWVPDGEVFGKPDVALEKRVQAAREESACPEFGFACDILSSYGTGGGNPFREAVDGFLCDVRQGTICKELGGGAITSGLNRCVAVLQILPALDSAKNSRSSTSICVPDAIADERESSSLSPAGEELLCEVGWLLTASADSEAML